jgi:hypothetical protein
MKELWERESDFIDPMQFGCKDSSNLITSEFIVITAATFIEMWLQKTGMKMCNNFWVIHGKVYIQHGRNCIVLHYEAKHQELTI